MARKSNRMIEGYFGLSIDLDDYLVMRDGGIYEYFSKDRTNGFTLVTPIKMAPNYKSEMEYLRKLFTQRALILREFVDYENKIEGFSWRMRER